ncbi:nucleotide pyrophosphohydrolase [Paenibacillus sp. SC116]|uniref:nucleotide pyrophosphohydrolase n=1 Tax=Paenibacillus sp. SC116 TaxID=2968986 RepID=UPI00215A508C|nr:nucleotide pyrophosphohydrolase [Paenibacillus sp. SC116]MCR8842936.1 nucleotide pyrophosphohydrolase [Paenibacillus sp. SC116]
MSDHQRSFSLENLRDKPLAEMQREVDQYISQFKEGYFSPLAMLARLTEEAGELAREVNHFYGEKPKKSSEADNSIEMELGDVLFILLCFANSLGIDLTEAHDKVMDKFNTRDANRWTRIEQSSNVGHDDNGKVDES